jgi:predicted GNAT family acetyltransferase
MLKIVRALNPTSFQKEVLAFLCRHEAENNLILGVLQTLATGPFSPQQPPVLAKILREDSLRGLLVMNAPHAMLLSQLSQIDASNLADLVCREGMQPPGVTAHADTAQQFADHWCALTQQAQELFMRLRLFQLQHVQAPRLPLGHARFAEPTEVPILVRMIQEFSAEAMAGPVGETLHDLVAFGVKSQKYLIWDLDGEIVSMAAKARTTPNGAAISSVYTPPAYRGRGFASACVADLAPSAPKGMAPQKPR